jgi:hypothetical protein
MTHLRVAVVLISQRLDRKTLIKERPLMRIHSRLILPVAYHLMIISVQYRETFYHTNYSLPPYAKCNKVVPVQAIK